MLTLKVTKLCFEQLTNQHMSVGREHLHHAYKCTGSWALWVVIPTRPPASAHAGEGKALAV